MRCSLADFSRKTRRAASKGSIISANPGTPSTRSWIRCSKPTTPTIPTFSPKLRNKPRISFSIARAFSWSIFRAARSALRFWLASVLTCTGWNKPTRIICAIPRASLRSLLLTCALRNAFACRVSMQIAETPASANPLNSPCDRGPASRPTRSSRHAGSPRTVRSRMTVLARMKLPLLGMRASMQWKLTTLRDRSTLVQWHGTAIAAASGVLHREERKGGLIWPKPSRTNLRRFSPRLA